MTKKKCAGCGAVLQSNYPKKSGYIDKENSDEMLLCKRCFRIKNYGEYQDLSSNDEEYKKVYDSVITRNGLFLYLCDILSLDSSLDMINEIKGNVILVITKCDLLPKSVKEYKLKEYIKSHYDLNIKEVIFISSIKNYNVDLLMGMISKYQIGSDVYILGKTNSGKSTLINQLCKTCEVTDSNITTSLFPATTIDTISIKLSDTLNIIDTPGLIDTTSYLYNADGKTIKKITPKKEIKPITYQMKPKQSIIIDDLARIDYLSDNSNSFTLYMSRSLTSKRISLNTNDYLRKLNKYSFDLEKGKDIVINGLLFCKVVGPAKIDIYVKKGVCVHIRDNLI